MNMKLIKNRNLRLLILGGFVSLIGSEMQHFALSLYILRVTGSVTAFASVLAVSILPRIILGPIVGVVVDWMSRKKIIVYVDIIRSIVVLLFFLLHNYQGYLSLFQIYGLVIIMTFCSIIFQPAVNTVIPTIVKKEELVSANSLNIFSINLGRLISPPLAAALFAVAGLPMILLVNSISFIISALSEVFIEIPLTTKKPKKINLKSFARDFSVGLNYIKEKQFLFNIIILGIVINFAFEGFYSIGIIYVSKEVLQVSDSLYSLLQSLTIVAAMSAPFFIGKINKKLSLSELLFWNFFAISILFTIVSFVSSKTYINLFSANLIPFVTLTALVYLIMLITSIGNISLFTIYQKEVPNEMLGRVGTLMDTGLKASIPISQMVFGAIFDVTHPWVPFLISSLIIIVTILIMKKALLKKTETNEIQSQSV